jgi:VCBS repeat-containing protein
MADIDGTDNDDVIRAAALGGSQGGLPDATNDGDTITTGLGNDTVLAGSGDDDIDTGAGSDTVDAGDGNDIVEGGDGIDALLGGAGFDTLDFTNAPGGVFVVLGQGDVFNDGYGNTEVGIFGFEHIYGSNNDDPFLAGSGGFNAIYGQLGNDQIFGGGGDDVLAGQQGEDFVVGEEGQDTLYGDQFGGAESDTLIGGRTDQISVGEVGRYVDDNEADTFFGGGGDDIMVIGLDDIAQGEAGDDTFAFAIDQFQPVEDQPLAIGTAVFAGNRADYSIYVDGGMLKVEDLVGDRGIDTVGSALLTAGIGPQIVAFLQFDDETVDVLSLPEISGNQAPFGQSVTLTIDANTGAGTAMLVSDPEGQSIQFVGWTNGPANGVISDTLFDTGTNELSFSYAPNAGFVGTDSFDFLFQDSSGAVGTGNVTVTVLLDSAVADFYTVGVGRTLSVDAAAGVAANDADANGDAPTAFTLTSPPDAEYTLAFDGTDGSFNISQAAPAVGTAIFSYEADFPDGTTNTAPVFVNFVELAETLVGDDNDNTIFGYGENDDIDGAAGHDTIDAGTGDDTVRGGGGDDTVLGGTGDDTVTGGAGNDTITGGGGLDAAVFSGLRAGYSLAQNGIQVTVTDIDLSDGDDGTDTVRVEQLRFADQTYNVLNNYDPLAGATDGRLVNGLGGAAGFGENILNRNDDSSSAAISVTSLFGGTLDFYGLPINQIFVNNNGNITFTQPIGQFNPTPLGASTAFAIIAGAWCDLDTRSGVVAPSAGGNSTGTNLVYWDLDDTTQTFTATWDDVANYSFGSSSTVAFQLQLVGRGDGDFDIIYRYEYMDASRARRAGFANQDDTAIFELPGSGTTATSELDTLVGNTGLAGVWRFSVRDGSFTPTAAQDAYVTDEDTQLVVAGPGVLGNDADPLGRPLTAVLSTNPANGTVAFNIDGSFTYTPFADFNGTDSFTYQAVADTLGSGVTTVSITVNGANDAPRNIFINDNTTPENLVSGVETPTGVTVGTLSATDPESPLADLAFALIDDAGGRFVLDGRVLKTAGVLDYEDATFRDIVVRVTDPQGAETDQTIRIFVDNINEGPTALSFAGGAIDENSPVGTLVGTLYAEDPDGDEVFFFIASGPVTVDDDGRVYTTTEFDFEDQQSVAFVAGATALGDSISMPFTFAISDVNEEPTANDDQADTLVNEAITIDPTTNDEDEDSSGIPVIVGVGPAANGTATQTGGFSIQYTPQSGFVGTDSFTYTISDGEFESTATITVTVRPGDVVAVPDGWYISEDDGARLITVVGNDYRVLPDGTVQDSNVAGLTMAPATVSNTTFGTLVGGSDFLTLYYTPSSNFYGVDTFTYRATDGYSESNLVIVTIYVNNVNDDPYQTGAYGQTSGRFDAVENQVLTQVLDFDQIVLDLDAIVYDGQSGPAQFLLVDQDTYTTTQGGTLAITSSFGTYRFTYTPPQDFSGTDTVAITYNDYEIVGPNGDFVPVGGDHTALLTFLVEERTPVARADTYTTDIGFFVLGNVLANDRSPAGLSLRVADYGGEITIAEDGGFSFVADASGTYTAEYYAEDSEGNFTEIVTLTVVVRPEPLYIYPISYTAYIWGDPHLVTYDGLSYDFQGYGEFVLTKATTGAPFEVQVRTSPWYEGAQVTIVEAVAAKIGDHTIMLDTAGALLVDGAARTVVRGGDPLNLSGNVALFHLADGEYVFVDKTSGDQVRVVGVGGSYLNVKVGLSDDRVGDMQGVLGDANGSTANDLQLADGTVLGQPLDFFDLYGDYADAWRVTDANSLFTYAPGQGTADFQVSDFPPAPVRSADLPAAAVAAAAQIVADAGITDPLLAEAAILDLLLTGDERFIAGAAAGQDPNTGLAVFVPPAPPLVGLISPMGDVSEGDSGTTTLTFTVFRTGNLADAITVDWAVQAAGLGITDAADHGGALPSGQVALAIGVAEATFTVDVSGDLVAELNEDVRVVLTSTPAGYTVASATAQQTVLNDDGAVLPDAIDDAATTNAGTPVIIAPLANDIDPIGAGVAISGVGAAAGGTVLQTGNLLTYTPNQNFSGQDGFTYTVMLAGGGTDTATVTIDVAAPPPAPNALPVAGTDAVAAQFETALVIQVADLLANDSDPDNDILAFTGIQLAPGNGTAVFDAAAGTIIYTPNAGFTGADAFAYMITDGTTPVPGIVNITVAASTVNAAPVASNDSATGDEDTVIAGNVLGNDTDANGDALTATLLVQATNGVVVLNPDGSFTYTPDANFNGADSFTYRASDGTLSDTAQVQITVSAVNDAPVATAETVAADEAIPTEIDVLANDTDIDGDTLEVIDFAVLPIFGTVAIVNNKVVYTANDGAGGQQDFFRYVISDGAGDTAQGDVTIDIADINTRPVANDDDATTDEDTPIVVAVLANDTDDGAVPVAVAITTGPSHGTAVVTADGQIEYTPGANFNGADTVEYTLTDEAGQTDTAILTITIDPLNDAPTGLVLSNSTVAENSPSGTVVGTLSALDVDGDTLGFAIQGSAGPFAIVGNQLLVNGPLDFESLTAYPLVLAASDGNGGSTTLPVVINVTDVNEGGPTDYGVRFSNNSVGQGLAPAGPFFGPGGTITVTPNTAFGTLVENAGVWNSVKNAVTQGGWNAALGDVITVANFVDVRLDFTNALDRDLTVTVVGAKRGGASLAEAGVVTGAGDDSVTWVFHSNEAGWTNTAAIRAGAGNDTVSISDVLRSTIDNTLLADNAAPGNGSFWRGGYDGRFSTATVDGGAGDDSIEVVAASLAKLVALGGSGNDTIRGGAGADDIAGGDNNDLLTGGLGADRFRFDGSDGTDQIADFSVAQADRVVLSGSDTLALAGIGFTFGTTSVTAANGHVWTAADFLFA